MFGKSEEKKGSSWLDEPEDQMEEDDEEKPGDKGGMEMQIEHLAMQVVDGDEKRAAALVKLLSCMKGGGEEE